jgi:4-diphosphocytidyl-2-C-methyl-D-erythritol kinase
MTLTVSAPAKINFTLEVLSKRSDGYHEIRSVIQTIDLCDRITFDISTDITIKSDTPEWNAEKSLVSKAVVLFRENTGFRGGVSVYVDKRIPMMAGLGGDSSDAAAVLRGLNILWETSLPDEKLHQMAEKLGSDVPFFLYGGTALIEGRGEKVTPLPPVPEKYIVLVIPPIEIMPGKTGRLFESLTPDCYTDGGLTSIFIRCLKNGLELPPFFNTFENVAFTVFSGLDKWGEYLLDQGILDVHLAGSGPVLFTAVKDKTTAETLCNKLDNRELRTIITCTVSDIKAGD